MPKLKQPVFGKNRVRFVSCAANHTSYILNDSSVQVFGFSYSCVFKVPYLNGLRAVHVSCGSGHSCIVLSNGDVKLFGDNRYGQLDVPINGLD